MDSASKQTSSNKACFNTAWVSHAFYVRYCESSKALFQDKEVSNRLNGSKRSLGLKTGLETPHEGCFKTFSTLKAYCCAISMFLVVYSTFIDKPNTVFLHFQTWKKTIYF